jgi:outer membrane protein OmpA-like peptidoglycan-associated protein
MKRNAILFITLFFIALSPAYAQTAVDPGQGTVPADKADPGTVPAVQAEQAAAPVPSAGPAAVGQKAPEPKKASAPEPKDRLPWWPTDAQPAPVRDEQRGGYWWWPSTPGTVKDLWGNRGYAYVNKIIYDWQGSGPGGGVKDVQVRINDIGFPESEKKPSLLVKRTVRNLMLQFKVNSIEIKPEHAALLKKAAATLKRDKEANILITIHKDTSGLGSGRTQAVTKFLQDQGVAQERIYILAPEKFQEAGLTAKQQPEPGTVQVLIAEVKEVMIPGPKDQ